MQKTAHDLGYEVVCLLVTGEIHICRDVIPWLCTQLFNFGSSPYLMFELSCFSGDVVLKDLKLKAEALNSLKLPVAVKSGFVGTITLKVAIFLLLLVDFFLFFVHTILYGKLI